MSRYDKLIFRIPNINICYEIKQ